MDLLVEDEADQERQRVRGNQLVSGLTLGELEHRRSLPLESQRTMNAKALID
jgi:hypothetical protein